MSREKLYVIFDEIIEVGSGATLCRMSNWGFGHYELYDNNDDLLVPYRVGKYCRLMGVDRLVITDATTRLESVIDFKGNVIVPCKYKNIYVIGDAYICQTNNRFSGDVLVEDYTSYSMHGELLWEREGVSGVKPGEGKELVVYTSWQKGDIEVISQEGKTIIPYRCAEVVKENPGEVIGYIVKVGDKYGIINQVSETGYKYLVPAVYDYIYGDEQYPDPYNICKKGDKFGVLDKEGSLILPCKYMKFHEESKGKSKYIFATDENGEVGVFDLKGREIVPCIYDEATWLDRDISHYNLDLLLMRKENTLYAYTTNGIKIEQQELREILNPCTNSFNIKRVVKNYTA